MCNTQCMMCDQSDYAYIIYCFKRLIWEFQTGLEDPESMLYVYLVLMYTLYLNLLNLLALMLPPR